jgi:hypothetical protein
MYKQGFSLKKCFSNIKLHLQRAARVNAHRSLHVERETLQGGAGTCPEPDVHELGPHVVAGGPRVQPDVGGQLKSIGCLLDGETKIENETLLFL